MNIKLKNCLAAAMAVVAISLSVSSCKKVELTDGDKFAVFYPGVTDIGPSTNMDLNPTYHGEKAVDFKVTRVTLDGKVYQTEAFQVVPETGQFQIRNTDDLPVGVYSVSISCVSGGQYYEFPDAVTVNMMRPIPEGITVDPEKIELALSTVTDMNSEEALPKAQITTEGEHISIQNYYISAVKLDGVLVEDWADYFSVNSNGEVSVLRNQNFVSGVYVIDFKLTTAVVDNASEDGIFTDALTIDITSPPVSLAYPRSKVKVDIVSGYSTGAPKLIGSVNGINYSFSSVTPEGTKVTIDEKTGVITLDKDHGLTVGTEVTMSVCVKNNFGEKTFNQVFAFEIVEKINEITVLEYNDSTVWHNTKFALSPKESDGDEKSFSFVNLPEALSVLKIDETTGKISAKKGNEIPLGDYALTVYVENSKGSMTKEIKLTVIENPYFFTYVHWGNNLNLSPETDYASQHRVSTTNSYEFEVKSSDIKEGVEVVYAIKGGSKTNCVTIDESTGKITTDPTVLGNVNNMRAHFVFVTATTGKGTSGETVVKTPVFLDFNCARAENGYIIEYTPFVFQCNPKSGGVSAVPTIKKADGSALSADELSKITMDFRRSFNYWNIDGPDSHANGAPNADKSNFLSHIWVNYYSAINIAYNSGSRDPLSYYGRPLYRDKSPGYVDKDRGMALYIAPEKWKNADGYADGIFTGQITFADTGADPSGAADPYKMFPLFVWFDTEF